MATIFIAEIGSNHNGSLPRALELIDAAAAAGCMGVKFQRFRAETLYTPAFAGKVKPWMEVPDAWWPTLRRYTNDFGMKLGTSVFAPTDIPPVEDYVDFLKVASYSLLDERLLRAVHTSCRERRGIMLGTGMATYGEIDVALLTLAYMPIGARIALLHCVSAYPVAVEHCRLANLQRFKKRWPFAEVGWSDHSVSPGVILKAVAEHASVIEVHLDLSDRKGKESGSGHCWDFRTLQPVIQMVKEGDRAMGVASKDNNPAEVGERDWRADPSDGLRPMKSAREPVVVS